VYLQGFWLPGFFILEAGVGGPFIQDSGRRRNVAQESTVAGVSAVVIRLIPDFVDSSCVETRQ
jgi:hypothetical protein